jgi:uncharacterized protein (TIGR02118 family)
MNDTRVVIERRSALAVLSAGAILAALGPAKAQQSGIKLTVLYTEQKNPEKFTKYYMDTHMPMVDKAPGVARTEVATVLPQSPDQPKVAFWRITEVYWDSAESMQKTFATPEWKTITADVQNFADPGTISFFVAKIGT